MQICDCWRESRHIIKGRWKKEHEEKNAFKKKKKCRQRRTHCLILPESKKRNCIFIDINKHHTIKLNSLMLEHVSWFVMHMNLNEFSNSDTPQTTNHQKYAW